MGLAMGLFEMSDLAGNDVSWRLRQERGLTGDHKGTCVFKEPYVAVLVLFSKYINFLYFYVCLHSDLIGSCAVMYLYVLTHTFVCTLLQVLAIYRMLQIIQTCSIVPSQIPSASRVTMDRRWVVGGIIMIQAHLESRWNLPIHYLSLTLIEKKRFV